MDGRGWRCDLPARSRHRLSHLCVASVAGRNVGCCQHSAVRVVAMSPTLPMTAALSPLATKQGHDLTPLARAEHAFNDMLSSVRKFDGSYEEAKARFDAAIKGENR